MSRGSRRLLFLTNVDWAFRSHRLPIAIEAKRRGFDVHIACEVTDRGDELREYGFEVHHVPIARGRSSALTEFGLMIRFYRLFRRVRPDLVHLVSIKPLLLGGVAASYARVPAVVGAVSGQGFVAVAQDWQASLRRIAVSWLYRLAFRHRRLKIIYQNADDRRSISELTNLAPQKSVLIRGSGVDLQRFAQRALPEGPKLVVMACRLIADKGVWEFVSAASSIRRQQPEVRFALVGTPDPVYPNTLTEADLTTIRNEGAVELWGHRSDMENVMAQAHIVVLPSYREGLPKVLLEAAACGRAVITSDVPGCRDAIEPGQTGLLVPVRDEQALAAAIKSLLDNPERCNAFGAAGRKLALAEFDITSVVDRHIEIYDELLKQPSSPNIYGAGHAPVNG